MPTLNYTCFTAQLLNPWGPAETLLQPCHEALGSLWHPALSQSMLPALIRMQTTLHRRCQAQAYVKSQPYRGCRLARLPSAADELRVKPYCKPSATVLATALGAVRSCSDAGTPHSHPSSAMLSQRQFPDLSVPVR
jgi:hypothetical protein